MKQQRLDIDFGNLLAYIRTTADARGETPSAVVRRMVTEARARDESVQQLVANVIGDLITAIHAGHAGMEEQGVLHLAAMLGSMPAARGIQDALRSEVNK